ncbi:hypothetical protein NCCP2222_08300 [Sporosarcina sp. NCCP-2222]|uniref:hypothetical protein n=1 Tax=Sporosarcina sp. NCCP-2222 TaxID=2935073 RepID=UPI002086D518|nr:hypothetical protein [Sporosarcina sp. NCCP-2222]GKV54883.1 hypothetical protein NCCP2222_08300 [Sporosarcina sp. NCCP-2222]
MNKRITFLLLVFALVLSLAACSNKTDESDSSKGGNTSKDEQSDAGQQEDSKETGVKNDLTIGLTMDEFEEAFNANAERRKLPVTIKEYEWQESDDTRTASIQLDKDVLLSVIEMPKNKEIKAIKLELEGIEAPREDANVLIETVIESVQPELNDEEKQRIMDEVYPLKEETSEAFERTNRESYWEDFHYILRYEQSNWYEFIVANREDT